MGTSGADYDIINAQIHVHSSARISQMSSASSGLVGSTLFSARGEAATFAISSSPKTCMPRMRKEAESESDPEEKP